MVTMAPRSGKHSKTSTIKHSTSKKTIAKKNTVKKRTARKRKKRSGSKKGMITFFILFVMISLVAFGYYLGRQEKTFFSQKNTKTILHKKGKHYKKTESYRKKSKIFSKVETKKPEQKKIAALPHTKLQPKVLNPQKKVVLSSRSKKPKLVIIIDDISNRKQLMHIQALHMAVTPSIFPPSHLSMQSHILAKNLKHYMVHLPMESGNRQFNKQYKTLKTSFSKAQMEARIKEIRRLFPTARYINNHTGSVFTNNYKVMYTLYGIMKKEGFTFIDSRTIASTKVKQIAHQYGDAYVARDVFIDNVQKIPYIHSQLKKAVRIAKKKGYAIAIGHPHKVTMQALASAKDLFRDVELVYIDQIFQK